MTIWSIGGGFRLGAFTALLLIFPFTVWASVPDPGYSTVESAELIMYDINETSAQGAMEVAEALDLKTPSPKCNGSCLYGENRGTFNLIEIAATSAVIDAYNQPEVGWRSKTVVR